MNAYSKYLLLKSAIEDLFGRDAWYALKESNHLGTWRKYTSKTLQALELAIKDTVEIYDDDWIEEVITQVNRGLEAIKAADSIDEVIGTVAGTLVEVSFLQVGLMPRRHGRDGKYPLRKGKWRLNAYRSVVYLQTRQQKENFFLSTQRRRRIGFEKQLDLQAEYRESKSELSYAEWCTQREEDTGVA